jgi:uncharacterized protein with NRDE domain
MCLILVAWRAHPEYPCIVAANRDEFFERASAAAHWWQDRPEVLAGRDLIAGGTWLGVTRAGRFAALTNYRAPRSKPQARSRGLIVADTLTSDRRVEQELALLRQQGGQYEGFNLMFSDGLDLGVYESVSGVARQLPPGIYGLSNHLLDTPWPKVRTAKARLQAALTDVDDTAAMLELLRDDRPANDAELPRTGVSVEWERLLSSAFVRGRAYGTRCSTLIRFSRAGHVSFDEWSWNSLGEPVGRQSAAFDLPVRAG